jgi:hypothetical protein
MERMDNDNDDNTIKYNKIQYNTTLTETWVARVEYRGKRARVSMLSVVRRKSQ